MTDRVRCAGSDVQVPDGVPVDRVWLGPPFRPPVQTAACAGCAKFVRVECQGDETHPRYVEHLRDL